MAARLLMFLLCAASTLAAAQSTTSALERHIENAQEAETRQDCGAAAREYTAAVKLLPSNAELRTNQGIALYCNDQFSEASAALQKALQLKPSLAAPHLFLGLSAYHLSEEALAIKELEIASRTMPEDATAKLWLGYAYLADHKASEAIQQFEAVLQLQPGNVDAQYAIGETYFEVGKQKTRELEQLAPRGRGVRQVAAEQEVLMGKSPAGMEQTANVPWVSDREQQLYSEALGAETKAHMALQAVLDRSPDSARGHFIQGDAYSLQRKNDSAIKEYEAVLKQDPKLPGVRLAMANCLMQINRFKDALAALTEELKLQPRSADVWASVGRVQQALGNDADALLSLKKATALPNPPPAARLLLGKALLRLGDANGALPELEEALREGADPSTTNYLLARAYRVTGDRVGMKRALDAYQQNSRDAAERQAASALTSDPKSVRTEMTVNEIQEADALSAKHQ